MGAFAVSIRIQHQATARNAISKLLTLLRIDWSDAVAGQTLTEKIATRHAVGLDPGRGAHAGDFVNIRPRHIMTHDNTSAVMGKFQSIVQTTATPAAARVHDPTQPVFAIDHDIQNTSPKNLAKYARIEAFRARTRC